MREEQSAESSESDDDHEDAVFLQTEKILEKKEGFDGWDASMEKFPGTVNEFGNFKDAYERKIPEVFDGDAADTGYYPLDNFTKNLIENYAVEAKSPVDEGKVAFDAYHPQPSGHFFITKETGRKVAKEVLCTHFSKCGEAGETYLDEQINHDVNRWEDAWKYWDVNDEGKVDAVGSSVLFRYLCKPLGELDLQ